MGILVHVKVGYSRLQQTCCVANVSASVHLSYHMQHLGIGFWVLRNNDAIAVLTVSC